jgi:hypothetical protein
MFYNDTINLTSDVTMDLLMTRRIEVTGRVYWDQDQNNESSPDEGVEDAVVAIVSTDGESEHNVTTDASGFYRRYVNVDLEGEGDYLLSVSHPAFTPNETEWELAIDRINFTKDLPMTPLNITVNGTTFLDLNENGKLNRYESGIQVDGVKFWDAKNASMSYEMASDANGSFNVTIPPGEYNVLAWAERPGDALVYMGIVQVEPSGDVLELNLPMRPGRRVSGIMYFHNHTGINHTIPEVNLTFTPLDGMGLLPLLEVGNGQYSAYLPDGRYRVNGTYSDMEFGVEMSYLVDHEFRLVLRDRGDVDLNFSKVEEYRLELWWDDVAPVYIDENSTANFTVHARNTGSMNGTFDLSVDVPADWTYHLEVDNVSLNMSQVTHFWVLINSSAKASADVHTSTVLATPRDSVDDPSELDLEVHINQYYGFSIKVPDVNAGIYFYDEKHGQHHVSYNIEIENSGNGPEIVNLTFQSVLDWFIEIPMSDVELGPHEPRLNNPIEVDLPSEGVLQAQTLIITGTPQNAPDGEPVTVNVPLVFPDLKAKKGKVSGDVAGEPLEWPEDAPGFGSLSVVLALTGVALVARRRRRWQR